MSIASLFAEMMATLPARRGSVHEQFDTRLNAKGEEVTYGPYYLYSRSVDGRTVSKRVSKQDYPRFVEEIKRGKQLAALIERLWEMAEKQAASKGCKKKRHSTKSKKQQ